MGTHIGVDLGGTKVLAARVDQNGRAEAHVKQVTPVEGPEAVVAAIAQAVETIANGCDDPVVGVGVGAPGPISDGVMLHAPNLSGFDDAVPLGAMLEERLGLPVVLGNDANVGTLGEAMFGAARGGTTVVGCWLGTGIGGGLVLDGKVHHGSSGTAGELGHVPVTMDGGRWCGCGRHGCVEAYAGRAAMAAAVQEAIAAGERTSLPTIMASKGKDRLTSGVWKRALKDGDPLAVRLMEEAVAALGVAIAGVVNVLDVDTVVFGGGLAEKLGQEHVDRIADAVRPRLIAPEVPRRWVLAELGDDSGVIGAAALTHTG